MEKEFSESDYMKAGSIAGQARTFGLELIAPGTPLLQVAERVEAEIIRLGGKPAFPVNISRNSEAAHYTPVPGDKESFREGDVVKLDLGVHINGFVADTALTKVLSENPLHLSMKKAAENALSAAGKVLSPGVKVSEIGAAIESEITALGFRPIYNLTGHMLKKYDLHAGLSIPNYPALSGTVPENCAIAIEPFATDGDGYVYDGRPSEIYLLEQSGKRPRLPIERALAEKIRADFSTLPFTSRWLPGEGPERAILRRLVLGRHVHNYPVLVEKSGGIVAQAEHTFLVSGGKAVPTTARE